MFSMESATEATSEVRPQETRPLDTKAVTGVLQTAQIALDNYDDIFSDFDPSPYEIRLISEDFLRELHRHYHRTGKGDIIVSFTIPGDLRVEKTEALIKKRIRDYFKGRIREVERERRERVKHGIARIVVGVVLSALLLTNPLLESRPFLEIISVLIWFLIWSGLEPFLEVATKLDRRRAFHEKFLKAEYRFVPTEEVVKYITESQAYR